MEKQQIGREATNIFVNTLDSGEQDEKVIDSAVEKLGKLAAQLESDNQLDLPNILISIAVWNDQFEEEKGKEWILIKLITPLVPLFSSDIIKNLLDIIGSDPVTDHIISLLSREDALVHMKRALLGGVKIPKSIKKFCTREDLIEECLNEISYLTECLSSDRLLFHGSSDRERLIDFVLKGMNPNHIDSDGHSFWFRVVKRWIHLLGTSISKIDGNSIPSVIRTLNNIATTVTINEIIEVSKYRFICLPRSFDTDISTYRDEKGRNLLQKLIEEVSKDNNCTIWDIVEQRTEWVKGLPNISDIIDIASNRGLSSLVWEINYFIDK